MLVAAGLQRAEAMELLAMLEGAMLLANALEDTGAFEMATTSY
jgi:Na+/H+ antiporter NhaD/arsenite permease-like protein